MRTIALILLGVVIGHVHELAGGTHPAVDDQTTSTEDILGISIAARPISASWDGGKHLTIIQTDKYGRVHLSRRSIEQIARQVILKKFHPSGGPWNGVIGQPHPFQDEYDSETVGSDDLERWLKERSER